MIQNFFRKTLRFATAGLCALTAASHAANAPLKEGDILPNFRRKTQDGSEFELNSRKGQWTVLYFYPKADTPGCTKQACNFRDRMAAMKELGAGVYGVSTDEPPALAAFAKKYGLNFTLISDPKGELVEEVGAKMPIVTMSKRWTFILDPELRIRKVFKDVDPAKDPEQVAAALKELQAKTAPQAGKHL